MSIKKSFDRRMPEHKRSAVHAAFRLLYGKSFYWMSGELPHLFANCVSAIRTNIGLTEETRTEMSSNKSVSGVYKF